MRTCLSIVIANYNYGKYLKDAIKSVLQQCLSPICEKGRRILPIKGVDSAVELIICDAASTDESVDVIRSFDSSIAWWCSEKDSGQSEAFNKGFAHASGEWLTWLNADELLCDNVLVNFCTLIRRKPSAKWITGNYLGFSDEDGTIKSVTWGPHWSIPFFTGRHTPFPVFGPTSFWKRDVYEQIGPIDEKLHYAMDFDYWQRLVMADVHQTRLNCICWAFRIHADSKTSGSQTEDILARREAEIEYIRKKTGYRYEFKLSNPFYLSWLVWRLFDGSLLFKPLVKLYYIGRKITELTTVRILYPYRLNGYQFYMQWFADAMHKRGVEYKKEIRFPWNLKLLIGKLGLCFYTWRHNAKLIVCTGPRPEYFSWPWCYFYEIVPVVWDGWPKYWQCLRSYCKKMHVRTIFATSSQVAEYLRAELPGLDAIWLPEGIDTRGYRRGGDLNSRHIDILELGRKYKPVHSAIVEHRFGRKLRHLFQEGSELLFKDFPALVNGLAESKIVICYPRCDTHPEQAGNVETMTQRYWECMLSGALIVGRAPKELIQFCGYNPVVELGDSPADQLDYILNNIASYQELVDKNYHFAIKNASWESRQELVVSHLGV